MDRRERTRSPLLALMAAQGGLQAGIWTALPAIVQSFNAAQCTVECQPAVQAQVRSPSGSWVNATLPLCVDCPVLFGGGGGFTCTFPVAAQDEGLLIFSSRCIDAWWQSGKVSPQAELRMHDLSDGFFFPTGGMSNPSVPVSVSATAAELRTRDGESVVHLEQDLIELSLNAGMTSLVVDDTQKKVLVTATAGLWVNGIMVTVP